MRRTSGVLAHVTSLPGRFGIGDLGPAAYDFIEFLHRTTQGVWQLLPIGPTGYGDSPYQCFSSFAGNPVLVSLERLVDEGLLSKLDLAMAPEFPPNEVDYVDVYRFHDEMLRRSFARFGDAPRSSDRDEFASFCRCNGEWLDGYAAFMSITAEQGKPTWTDWEPEVVMRQPEAIKKCGETLAREIEFVKFVQFQFFRQWSSLKVYANERGVRLFGDIPIFVAHNSADVWLHPEHYYLDARGEPTVVAGVPPDYFSETGQLWGNPLYRWEAMAEEGYAWWVQRFRHAFQLFDIVRVDHFRGFDAYWEVPFGAATAIHGRWAKAPGAALFEQLEAQLGKLPIIAEDLGVITPNVDSLRDRFDFPGMRVLQFAFGDDPKAWSHRPHHYVPNCVAYTGTHDNDTALGWFHSKPGLGSTRSLEQIEKERRLMLRYLASNGREVHWDMIRAVWSSVAATAIAPLQDLLGLSSEARMNTPGTTRGNWRWRFRREQLTPEVETRLASLTDTFDRK